MSSAPRTMEAAGSHLASPHPRPRPCPCHRHRPLGKMMPRTLASRTRVRPIWAQCFQATSPLQSDPSVTLPTVSPQSATSRVGRAAGRRPPPPPPMRGSKAAACASTGRTWIARTLPTILPVPPARRTANSPARRARRARGARRTSSAQRTTAAASCSLANLHPHPRPPRPRPYLRLCHRRLFRPRSHRTRHRDLRRPQTSTHPLHLRVWTRVPPTVRGPMSSRPACARLPPGHSAASVRWCAVPVASAVACAISPLSRRYPHRSPRRRPPHRPHCLRLHHPHHHRRRRRLHHALRHNRSIRTPRTFRHAWMRVW